MTVREGSELARQRAAAKKAREALEISKAETTRLEQRVEGEARKARRYQAQLAESAEAVSHQRTDTNTMRDQHATELKQMHAEMRQMHTRTQPTYF